MITQAPMATVTGAGGYLGSGICEMLNSHGWRVTRLMRSPDQSGNQAFAYDLAMPVSTQVTNLLKSTDVLVHAAYDLSLTRASDIWRVNVEGTRRLLEAAVSARVRRIVVLSSMSAFDGTTQIYGRAKLDIEAMAMKFGGCAVRPGLVYGKRSGGMAGALRKLTRLPIVPVIAGGSGLYTVREDDLMMVIAALAASELPNETISVAHPTPVALGRLLTAFAAEEGRRCRLFPVPWQLVYSLLRTAEALRLRTPFRADSVLGLVRTANCLSGGAQLSKLGVTLQAFPFAPTEIPLNEKAA